MSLTLEEISNSMVADRWYKDTLTYSFRSFQLPYESSSDALGNVSVTTAMKNAVHQILSYIENIIDIDFVYTQQTGDIVFGSKYMDINTLGYSYMPGGTILNSSGDIYINARFSAADFVAGGIGWATLVHEIGHSLGLDHPFGDGYYSEVDIYDTVMSYNPYVGYDEFNHYYNTSSFTTYQPADIYALQSIYGAKQSSENNIYDMHKLLYANKLYGYIGTIDENLYTIYDAGGNDTISLDGFITTTTQLIDLNELHTSIISNGSVYHYLTIAQDTKIENVIGSSSNDNIILSDANNEIDGRSGIDSVFVYPSDKIRIDKLDNSVIISSLETGFDVINNVECIFVNDMQINLNLYTRNAIVLDSPVSDDIGRLYLAAFNRLPDEEGVKYFIKDFENGQSINQIANSFVISNEFKELYGLNVSNSDYIETLYNNVLLRSSDQDGYKYWQHEIDRGFSYADLLVSFADSEEFINLSGVYFGKDSFYVS